MPDCQGRRHYARHTEADNALRYSSQGFKNLYQRRVEYWEVFLCCDRGWRIGKPPSNRDLETEKARIREEGKARLDAVDGRWTD